MNLKKVFNSDKVRRLQQSAAEKIDRFIEKGGH